MSLKNKYLDIKFFFIGLYRKREVLLELAKRDMKVKNQGSMLGLVWNYLQPLLFILVLWLLFGLGFKGGNAESETPFILYLITGFTPWIYFTENLSGMTNIVNEHSYLVKKVDFSLGMLPISRLISTLPQHILFLFMSVIIALVYGQNIGFAIIQTLYYFIGMFVLLLGLGWISSSTSLFIKDVKNLVQLLVQFGFWLTPIFWRVEIIPESYRWLLNFNPMVYILNGYRKSIIDNEAFWTNPYEGMIFWGVAISLILCGSIVFRRLRPHFAEVV